MKSFVVLILTAAALTLSHARELCAQGANVSLDATLGGGHAFGGGPMNVRSFATLDALLAVRRHTPTSSSTVYGIALNLQGRTSYGDDCVIPYPFNGPCLKDFPNLASVGAVAGRSFGMPLGSSVAVLGGAGLYFPESNGGDGGTALGLQARIDAATAVKARTAFVVSVRGAFLPSLHGDSYRLLALGIGVRLQ